jgi:hypothetical protein
MLSPILVSGDDDLTKAPEYIYIFTYFQKKTHSPEIKFPTSQKQITLQRA